MSNCTIERRVNVTHGKLNISTGAYTAGATETVERPCDTPLFDPRERELGACRSCLQGWGVDGNRPTARGLEQIAAVEAKLEQRPRRRTLILACSATKTGEPNSLLSAIDRYDGPAYRTLRKHLAAAPDVRVLILSAEHGLISGVKPIALYDRRMNAARGYVLASQVFNELRRLEREGELADEIFVVAGKAYRDCILHAVGGTRLADRFSYSSGGIGDQLGQLKAYLLEGGR